MKSSRLLWGVVLLWAVGRTASAADASASTDSSTESSKLQEIVVTAQKRQERLEDVPLSMSVLQGDDLTKRNLTQLTDYAAYLPGVNVVDNGTPGFTGIALRGVTNFGATSTVGTYIDDVPVGSSAGWAFASATQLDLPPYDLDRIEVLRGPQGTLYGAGSMGGQLKYVLTAPSTDHFEVKGGADTVWVEGDQVGTRVRAQVNAPISSDLALLVSGFYTKTPGWVDNAYGGQQTQHDVNGYKEAGGRVALLWRPKENLTVRLNALGFWSYADGLDWVVFNQVTPVPNSGDVNLVTVSDPVGRNTQSFAVPQPVSRTFNLYSATVDWNPGPVAVTSATSWSKQALAVTRDFSLIFGPLYPLFDPTVPAGLNSFEDSTVLNKFTQELRFASPENQRLEWLLGLFYTAEKAWLDEYSTADSSNHQLIPQFQPWFFYAAIPTSYDERAVFGDLTWHISQSFDLIGGIRYSHNGQSLIAYENGTLVGGSLVTIKPPDSSAGVTTWSGTARYHLAHDSMVYARVATGYNPGGPNLLPPTDMVPLEYGSETVTSYELGVKSEFWDHRAAVDAAAFYVNHNNIQVGQVSNSLDYTGNGGKAVSKGAELQSSFSPLRGLNFGFNASYTKSELTSIAPTVTGGLLTGYQLPGVPEWAFAGTVGYDWTLPNTWLAHVGAGVHWQSWIWDNVVSSISGGGGPTSQLPSYGEADLDASLTMGNLVLKAYVRNLTNEYAFTSSIYYNNQFWSYTTLQPRTIGVGFDVKF